MYILYHVMVSHFGHFATCIRNFAPSCNPMAQRSKKKPIYLANLNNWSYNQLFKLVNLIVFNGLQQGGAQEQNWMHGPNVFPNHFLFVDFRLVIFITNNRNVINR